MVKIKEITGAASSALQETPLKTSTTLAPRHQGDTLAGNSSQTDNVVARFFIAIYSAIKSFISFLLCGKSSEQDADPFKTAVMTEGKKEIQMVQHQLEQIGVEKVVLFFVTKKMGGTEYKCKAGIYSPEGISEVIGKKAKEYADGSRYNYFKIAAFLVAPEDLVERDVTEVSYQVNVTEKGVETKFKVVEDEEIEDLDLTIPCLQKKLGPKALEILK